MKAGRRDQAGVLEIALGTSAGRGSRGRRWSAGLLVGAAKVVGDDDLPACAADQRRLDEIVAEDAAAEGRPAVEGGQAGGLGNAADIRRIALWSQ